MSLRIIFFDLTIFACIFGAVLNLIYVLTDQRRKAKNPLRAFTALTLIYLAMLFTGAQRPDLLELQLLRTGVLTSAGVFVLTCICIGEVITDWKRHTHDGKSDPGN